MKTRKFLMASTAALTIALGAPGTAQQSGNGVGPDGIPPGQMKQLMKALQELCLSDLEKPDALDCTLVEQAQTDPELEDDVVDMSEDLAAAGLVLPGMPEASGDQVVEDLRDALAPEQDPAQQQAEASAPEAAPNAEANASADVAAQANAETPAAEPEQPVAEAAPETQAPAPQAAEAAPAEAPAPTEQAAEAPAQTDAPEQAAEAAQAPAPAEQAAPAAETAGAPTEGAVDSNELAEALQQAEDNAQQLAEAAPEVTEAEEQSQANAEAALEDQAAQAVGEENMPQDPAPAAEQTATAEPMPQEPSPQAQADAVAQLEAQAPAAAAASGEGQAQEVTETVSESDVRRSDQDFDTSVNAAPAQQQQAAPEQTAEANEGDDGDDGPSDLIKGALVGFGALALNEILSNNDQVVSNSGDRVVVENNGQFRVLRNDDVLLRRPGADVTTYRYDDGSTRNVVTYDDGTVVETIRAADGRVLRRTRTLQDGTEVVLFDDTQQSQEVVVNDLPQVNDQGTTQRVVYRDSADADALARALASQQATQVNRTFSLNQVRNIEAVRHLVPEVTVETINFETNSAAIRPVEAEELAALGNAMREAILRNPREVFLIEGHTDAVGNYAYNLALSDRRAESVALALTEYFDVPPENMILQGYGESDLAVPTTEAERANRRAAVRRITSLLQGS